MLLVEMKQPGVHAGHETAFGTHLSQCLMANVFVVVDESEIALLDFLLRLVQLLQLLLVFSLVPPFQFLVLFVEEGFVVLQLCDVLQIPV